MSPSPPFGQLLVALLSWVWLIPFVGNVVLLVLVRRLHGRARQLHGRARQLLNDQSHPHVLKLMVGEDLQGYVDLCRDDPDRARVALMMGAGAIAKTAAEFEALESEQAMEAQRHAP